MTIETPAARIHAYLAGLSNAQTSAIDEGRYPHAHNLTGNAVKKLLLVLLAIWLGFAAAGSVVGTGKFGGGVGSLVLAVVLAAASWRTWYLATAGGAKTPGLDEQEHQRPWRR